MNPEIHQSVVAVSEIPTLTNGEKRLITDEIAALQSQINDFPGCGFLVLALVPSERNRWQDATPVNFLCQRS